MPEQFTTLAAIVEQLEACKFESEAGPLEKNVAFVFLKVLAEAEAEANSDLIELWKLINRDDSPLKRIMALREWFDFNHPEVLSLI